MRNKITETERMRDYKLILPLRLTLGQAEKNNRPNR